MLHHLIEGGYVQEIILSYYIPFRIFGKRRNCVKFCKYILNCIQLLSTCRIANSYKNKFLHRCFQKYQMEYYGPYCQGNVSWAVQNLKHTIDIISPRLQNRYQTGIIEYELYGRKLIRDARIVYPTTNCIASV